MESSNRGSAPMKHDLQIYPIPFAEVMLSSVPISVKCRLILCYLQMKF